MSEDKKMKMALFRFGVIAPLVSGPLEPMQAREIRRSIGERVYDWPNGRTKKIPSRTLCQWLYRYRQRGGFPALIDNARRDAGKCRAIPANVLLRVSESGGNACSLLPESRKRLVAGRDDLAGSVFHQAFAAEKDRGRRLPCRSRQR